MTPSNSNSQFPGTSGTALLGAIALLLISTAQSPSVVLAQTEQWNNSPGQSPVTVSVLEQIGGLPQVPNEQPPTSGFDSDGTFSIPVPESITSPDEGIEVRRQGPHVTVLANDVDLRVVLSHLSEESDVNIVISENVTGQVNTNLRNVPLWRALDAILKINGFAWHVKDDIVYVTKPSAGQGTGQAPGSVTGRRVQVFDLHFMSSEDVLPVVEGLLSPAGKAFAHQTDVSNARQTRERIVVEDHPERLEAVMAYLSSVDTPPRQVLIEAHVMQVDLEKGNRHGINLESLARIGSGRASVRMQGFADPEAAPGFMIGLDSTDMDSMLEWLQSDSNVRTLAAPKVLVVDGQQARIQIGSKFGYFVTTTTETSTLQSVDFLDIGVVLQVQPTITSDGQVMITVDPKVSGGRINPDTGLPEEDTTEAQTTVMLPSGKGMIVGGLIQESDSDQRSYIPKLGKLPLIGRLFTRANKESARQEVLIALTPHIVPYSPQIQCGEAYDFHRATRGGEAWDGMPPNGSTMLFSAPHQATPTPAPISLEKADTPDTQSVSQPLPISQDPLRQAQLPQVPSQPNQRWHSKLEQTPLPQVMPNNQPASPPTWQ